MLKFLSIAVIIVGIQLIVIPMMSIILGQEARLSSIILFFTYLALTTGELSTLRLSFLNKALILCGISVNALAVMYHVNALQFIQIPALQTILFSVLFCLFIFVGRALLYILYSDKSFSENYFKVNLLSAFVAIGWIFLLPYLGLSFSLALIGSLGLALSILIPSKAHEYIARRFEKPVCNKEDLWTLALGFVAGGFIALYFEAIDTVLSPTGFEFPIYLITIFLFFTLTAKYAKGISKILNPFEAVTLALSLFTAMIFLLFAEIDGAPLIYLGNIASFVHSVGLPHFIYTFSMVVILLLPYLFIASLIPLRDIQDSSRNHFFYCSLGNLLGLAIFAFVIPDDPMHIKIIVLCCIALLWLFRTRIIFSAFPIIILATYASLTPNIESNMVKQAFGTLQYVWLDDYKETSPPPLSYSTFNVKELVKKDGKIGSITEKKGHDFLSLGGYITSLASTYGTANTDVQAAFSAAEFYKPNAKILILGLGNHFILNTLDKISKKSDNVQIDVVDNFPGFQNMQFRQSVANGFNFDWKKTSANFIYDDALNYLAATSTKYNIIIWNLTVINYHSARKLFTTDFFSLANSKLTKSGVFIGNLYQNHIINCTNTASFDHIKYIEIPYDTSVFIAGKMSSIQDFDAPVFSKKQYCGNIENNTLANPFNFYTPVRYQTAQRHFFTQEKSHADSTPLKDYEKGVFSHQHIRIAMPSHWQKHQNGVYAFNKLYNTYKMVHFYDVGPTPEEKVAGVLKVQKSAYSRRENDLCFGAPSSLSQQILLEKHTEFMQSEHCPHPLISNVVASKAINDVVPTVSTFYRPEDYFQDIFPTIHKRLDNINNVYILDSGEFNYFHTIAQHLQKEAPSFIQGKVEQLNPTELLQKTLTPNDVIFFLTDNQKDYYNIRSQMDISKVLKVFTYGSVSHTPPVNSIQTLFWHPDYKYKGSSKIDNCQFAKLYQNEFDAPADFHAAFMFSSFQVLNHFNFDNTAMKEVFTNRDLELNTIVGAIKWRENGVPILHAPMYFHVDHDTQINLLNAPEEGFTLCAKNSE